MKNLWENFDKLQQLIIGILLIIFCVIIYLIIFLAKIDPNLKDVLIYAAGTANALLLNLGGYFFGSSQGSAKKSEILDKLRNGNNTTEK